MAEPDSNYVGDSGWDFPCDKCGACCRVIDCVFLTKENKCSIYGNRPFICDTKKMFDKIYSAANRVCWSCGFLVISNNDSKENCGNP